MSAESPRHSRSGAPLSVPSQPPPDRGIIHTVSDFISDVTLSTSTPPDPKDTILWARFETADINEPTPEGDGDNEISPLLLVLGYGSGVQVWLIPPNGEAQEVLSWRQGTVRVLRILPTPASSDCFISKRPLIALCDSAGPPPAFCALSFISVRGGEQVKSIKFKNAILDVQANKHSVVVSFTERFAVFDAGNLEDRMAITTCYPCPCPLGGSSPINPIALGDRWLAYADKKINPSKRSSGGCESEGVSSYTATVLHAAKSLSKGLRGLGESVASSLAGARQAAQSPSPPATDLQQPGVVTIIDIEGNNDDECQDSDEPYEPIVAHFVAHSDAIIALKFDASGLLLVTADRRGHDFHVFRINPHPCGPTLASVHHLYVLHRGDTTAKVQDIAISPDSRWSAISTLRGTTHVFPLTPYGGPCGVRTHTQPRVVNRLSRFHRSAGLPIHASSVPVTESNSWFANPRVPPYPTPVMVCPMAQLRPNAAINTHTITRNSSGRQRLSSLSEESSGAPLLARAAFSVSSTTQGAGKTALQSLYLMTHSGALLLYLLQPKPAPNVPKEKVCDESAIELEVEPQCQWRLHRPLSDLLAPLPHSSPLLQPPACQRCMDVGISEEERWLSQVEIVTHAGPHRRLWMGPQFVFKTYNLNGSSSSLSEADAIEVDSSRGSLPRSNPVNVPLGPLLIDDGSASSLEHSPSESFRRKSVATERAAVCDVQLKEDLAEAMKEDHGAERRPAAPTQAAAVSSMPGAVRQVDPQGTVVQSIAAPPMPVSPSEPCCVPNTDECTFHCSVRVSAPPPVPLLPTRALPASTTIPVQPQPPSRARTSPQRSPEPLTSHVVIPAALSVDQRYDARDASLNDDVRPIVMNRELLRMKTPEKIESIIKEREVEIPAECESLPKFISAPTVEVRPESASVRIKKSPTSKTFSENVVKDNVSVKECLVVNKGEDAAYAIDVTMKVPSRSKEKSPKIKSSDKRSKKNVSPVRPNTIQIIGKEDKNKEETQDLKAKVPVLCQDIVEKDVNELMVVEDSSTKTELDNVQYPNREPKVNEENNDVIIPKATAEPEVKDIKSDNESNDVNVCFTLNTITECRRDKKKKSDVDSVITNIKYKDPLKTKKLKTDEKFIKNSNFEEIITEQPHFVDVKSIMTNEIEIEFAKRKTPEVEIKTEQQAWDMLLNEPSKSVPQTIEKVTEEKPKSKRSRRSKFKAFTDEAIATKVEEDSFVEIHNIIDNQPTSSNDLVSIPTCFEDTAPFVFKQDQLKYQTFDIAENAKLNTICDMVTETPSELRFDEASDFYDISRREALFDDDKISNMFKSNVPLDYASAIDFSVPKENVKPRKAKSVSPFCDKKAECDDVIVIDSSKEDFPEIKITRGKSRKKLSVAEAIQLDKPVSPPKSWSSIAASGNDIKPQEAMFDEVCLQDKLIELCKRTDIMVAECDAPSELNFVEEHHVMGDLPPLEALEFALDDFKMEVMRDSLLEATEAKITSPLCKINIDDILCSIKDTTSKAIESSSFNYMSDFRITAERGGVKKKDEPMEKSSDDDNTSPLASQTDSDKDDKRVAGTASLVPSSKQVKAKKPRKKKK